MSEFHNRLRAIDPSATTLKHYLKRETKRKINRVLKTMSENIKVAVRVRPFNEREKRLGTKLIVSMNGQSTYLFNPERPKEKPREFTFDYSYWSHDGFTVLDNGYFSPNSEKYVDQNQVFDDLGHNMLDNAWQGYNCSMFAYGQTGSGKSYSIVGSGTNRGIVPTICQELFKSIEKRKDERIQFEITFSMLEIYNEQARDLLSRSKTQKGKLKIKESPVKGFYVEDLDMIPVGSYDEIRLRMNEGERHRTIASTMMNETSSRAHTIVTIQFAQRDIKKKISKISNINLVDLAGSERAKQTESTGDRFEEAKNINKSLMTLGIVIHGLCDMASGKKKVQVPYRDSMLTKLLKNALGGNSKTVMIAAIGPDAENYEQTLSTLRYADRAKSIRTKAEVNQSETDKIIKDLVMEKERLLRELERSKNLKVVGISDEDLEALRQEQEKEIQRYKQEIKNVEKSWQQKLEESRYEIEEMLAKEREMEEEEKKIPHLSNLNEDPALTGKLIHVIKTGCWSLGNGKAMNTPDLVLNGPRIANEHAKFTNKNGQVCLKPINGMVLHNGTEIKTEFVLNHQDRLRFGSNNLFVFIHPEDAERNRKAGKNLPDITYEYAQTEIAKHSGLTTEEDDSVLQEEVVSLMQLVQDVNAMAEELEKPTEFAIILVSPEAKGQEGGRTEVNVRCHDLETDNEYLWDRNKFLNRQCHMQEMYQEYNNTGQSPNVTKDKDPFWEPSDTEVIVGVASLPLNYLSHMLDFQNEPLTIIDHRAKRSGFLRVDVIPCDCDGNEDVDFCVEDPIDLIGKPMSFKLKIHQAMNISERYDKTWCRFKFYEEPMYFYTNKSHTNNPKYNFIHEFHFKSSQIDHKFIDYLQEKSLAIEIWGQQFENALRNHPIAKIKRTTEEKRKLEHDLIEWKKKTEDYENKLDQILCIARKAKRSKEMEKIIEIITD